MESAHTVPSLIAATDRVADIVKWYPATKRILERFGLVGFGQDVISRFLFQEVTVSDAAKAAAARLDELLADLNEAGPLANEKRAACIGCGNCTCGRQLAEVQQIAELLCAD